jgi:hypothetical protein
MWNRIIGSAIATAVALALGNPAQGAPLVAQNPPAVSVASQARAPVSSADKVFDVLVVRPIMFVMTAFSTGVYVASLPLIPLDSSTSVGLAGKNLVEYPAEYTFTRNVGDFGGPSTPTWPGSATAGGLWPQPR